MKKVNNVTEFRVAEIMVNDMALPTHIKNILIRFGDIKTLEDLIMINYEDLRMIRSLDKIDLEFIKSYVHGLGYKFLNEEMNDEELKMDNQLNDIEELKMHPNAGKNTVIRDKMKKRILFR